MYEVLQTRYFVRITDPYPDILCYRIDHGYSAQNDEFEWLLSQRIISCTKTGLQKNASWVGVRAGAKGQSFLFPSDIVSMEFY